MSRAQLASLLVGGTAAPWAGVGFAVDEAGRIPLANGALEFTGDGDGDGLAGLVVCGIDDLAPDVEGIPLRSGEPARALEHPNGAFELDHVVVVTDSIERTSSSIEATLGLEQRRVRETPEVRQAFHRFPDRGCIVEVVERPGLDRVGLWGLVINVVDLHDVAASLGPDLIGLPKRAVQPGRFIATIRGGAGLGVPTALMTPDT